MDLDQDNSFDAVLHTADVENVRMKLKEALESTFEAMVCERMRGVPQKCLVGSSAGVSLVCNICNQIIHFDKIASCTVLEKCKDCLVNTKLL